MVAHAYNSSFFGGRDQEDHGSRPVQAEMFMRPPSQPIKLGMVRALVIPASWET
jgi:hypothetical protein